MAQQPEKEKIPNKTPNNLIQLRGIYRIRGYILSTVQGESKAWGNEEGMGQLLSSSQPALQCLSVQAEPVECEQEQPNGEI